jgi:signal transduction histidine kinase
MTLPSDSPISALALSGLATYLAARREAILANWRTACEADAGLRTPSVLSREEFNDNVPLMLNGLEQCLRGSRENVDIHHNAAEHGLHRWHKGYELNELLKEIQVLHQILLRELGHYWDLNDQPEKPLMVNAYEIIGWFTGQTLDGSIEQYSVLQQVAAMDRVNTLQKTLDSLEQLTQQRGDLLRMATHDLRSSFGIIQGAASLLELANGSPHARGQMQEMLTRNLSSVQAMVSQLMDLARLEAGQERVEAKQLDVSELIRTQLATYHPLASERNLLLTADGPDDLLTESDPVLLQRIIQNLVLNALKHTASGFVSVSWSRENDNKWFLSVQDTGLGSPSSSNLSLARALEPTADSASALGKKLPDSTIPKPIRSGFTSTGEGIGLSIVKRLCELLKGSMDVETEVGTGTLFRIRLPTHWRP